jgi:radical SAM superfamily enzyme YgiQ (UPF0313 family)
MIRETVEIARSVKAWNPEFPVVLGGWHPSLLPQQTLEADFVDIVIRGQGESSMLEVVQHLEARESLDKIAGVGFKRDGSLVMNPERTPVSIGRNAAQGLITLRTSTPTHGCAGGAGQCIRRASRARSIVPTVRMPEFTGGNGMVFPPEQVVEETFDLSSRYGLEMLWIVDDNFLVDQERALAIAEGLVRVGASFRWSIQATTNLTARLSVDELRLLRRAGLHQICQGVDSASPKILRLMNKTFQDFDSIYLSAQRCVEAGIRPSFNIIFAYPGEDEDDRRQTITFILDVVPAFSRRGVLDKHLHAISRLAHHASRAGKRNRSAGLVRRLGGLLSTLHRPSLA